MSSSTSGRCFWVRNAADDYVHYHDHEWGFPVADDHRLFEKICLEGFQSGLSWLTWTSSSRMPASCATAARSRRR